MVEGNRADMMMKHVGLDKAMKYVTANESKISVYGCCGAPHVIPKLWGVMWKTGIGVLEVCYDDCTIIRLIRGESRDGSPIQ
jgi:hypothetical protein